MILDNLLAFLPHVEEELPEAQAIGLQAHCQSLQGEANKVFLERAVRYMLLVYHRLYVREQGLQKVL